MTFLSVSGSESPDISSVAQPRVTLFKFVFPTTTLLTTTTTTLLSSTFCILLLFHHTHTPTRIASAILFVLTTTAASITNTLLLYFSLPLITIHQRPQAHFQLRIQRILLSTIIATILLFQLPHVIVAPAAATLYKDGHWTHAVTILSRISVTAYCTREILLLAVYTWGVIKYLRPVIHHFHYESTHQDRQRICSTLLVAGCISLILNIANIVAVYTVHNAAAMAFFPFVVSTKVLVEGVAVGRLVGFVGASRQPRIGSVDTIVSVAEPPLVHSVGHLVQEMPDLEGGAGAGVSRRMSVV
ncbi:FAD dependent oxidoreductase family protein [Aspergillus niger]|uniref:FAD dependent oxidoreductase family protein n=1 Tax=Aspergillus niger TaxID=5061 RepID=A0A505I5V4_ASPNG|nr:FAD dependent oxidoreductase family protein [Aspergillus niger]